jgi:hypothetical protein
MISKRKRRRLVKDQPSGIAQAKGEADRAEASSPSLERLFGHVKFFSEFRDFDEHVSATRARLPERRDGNQSVEIAWRLFELGRDHFFVVRVIGLKLAEVGRGFLAAKSQRNPTVLLTLARSFMEHTASLSYQVNELAKVESDLSKQPEGDRILVAIDRHHSIIQKIYYGRSPKDSKMESVHINDMLEKLQESYPSEEEDYGRLCEYVHPNYGSNKLVSGGELGTGKLGALNVDELRDEVAFAETVVERCAAIALDLMVSGSKELIKLGSRSKIASVPGARTSQIFSNKVAYVGDGMSKDTAFYFSKARTEHEALKAFYEYLKANMLTLLTRRTVAVEDGYLFEIALTDKRNIWVKYKADVNMI